MTVQFSNFKTSIKEFLKLDEEIRSLSKAKLERMRVRDKLSKEIMNYYKTNNIHSLDLTLEGGKQQLELVESTRHPSVNQKFLREALVKYCNNDKIVDNMIDHILGEREQVSSVSFKLKRVIPRTKKSSSSSDSLDPMKLTEKYENDKIKDRFAKLAEYAIIKDGIGPLKQSCEDKEDKEDKEDNRKNLQYENTSYGTPTPTHTKKGTTKEVCVAPRTAIFENVEHEKIKHDHEVKKNIHNSKKEEIQEDEEDVDLDEIPEEETGYEGQAPKLDKELQELDEKKTFRTVISQKMDSCDNQIGSIPKLTSQSKVILTTYSNNNNNNNNNNKDIDKTPQLPNENNRLGEVEAEDYDDNEIKKNQEIIFKELELKAIDSWNKLKNISTKIPILGKWINLQNDKMKILEKKSKSSIDINTFNSLMMSIKTNEKECEKYEYSDEINFLRSNVLKYIHCKFKKPYK
jgi:hypothetical protein